MLKSGDYLQLSLELLDVFVCRVYGLPQQLVLLPQQLQGRQVL